MDTIIVEVGDVDVKFPQTAAILTIDGDDGDIEITTFGDDTVVPQVVGYGVGPKGDKGDITAELQALFDQTGAARDQAVSSQNAAAASALSAHNDAASIVSSVSASQQAAEDAADSAGAAHTSELNATASEGQALAHAQTADAARAVAVQAKIDAQAARDTNQATVATVTTARDEAVAAKQAAETSASQADESARNAQTYETNSGQSAADAASSAEDAAASAEALAAFNPASLVSKANNGSDFANPAQVLTNIGGQAKLTIPSDAIAQGGADTAGYLWTSAKIRMNVTAWAAPALSPAFTGTPSAPTAPTNTNTTQLATTAFVQAVVAALVNSSPATLDTLKELADALGNDANFSTTMTTQLGLKAPIASPSFTGNATVAGSVIVRDNVVARGGDTEGGQLVLGYGGAVAKTIAGQGANTWNVDVNASNAFRIFKVDASSVSFDAITIAESTGAVSFGARPTFGGVSLATVNELNSTVTASFISPTMTGTPVAPTAAVGDNTTQVATTAFVQATVAALVAAAPAALDTLKELATALGNDANFSATMTTQLSLKAPLASPALTGTPTAPTPASTDNSTQIATTAFVQGLVGSNGRRALRIQTTTPTSTDGADGDVCFMI
jgi:hypothetical protein